MAEDVREMIQSRYPLPPKGDIVFLQKYWNELAALGERVEPNTLGPAEIAIGFDPRGAADA